MIENKFLHYETQAGFEADIDNISENSIVFVKDSKRIYTHGECYNGANYDTDIENLWEKIEELTGEQLHGISMTVDKEYFIGENGANIHIAAHAAEKDGVFEYIAFYINNEKLENAEAYNVAAFEFDTEIQNDAEIKCEAIIKSRRYTASKTIKNYKSFWMGAGTDYNDVMILNNVRPILNNMRGAYDIHVADGDHIIIILGENIAPQFIRADMNGFEIPFDSGETIVKDGNNYVVFTSQNTYIEGIYNIDING